MFWKVALGRGQLNHRRDGATQAQPPANPTTRPSPAPLPVPWTLGKSAKGAVGPVARLLGPLATSECHPPSPTLKTGPISTEIHRLTPSGRVPGRLTPRAGQTRRGPRSEPRGPHRPSAHRNPQRPQNLLGNLTLSVFAGLKVHGNAGEYPESSTSTSMALTMLRARPPSRAHPLDGWLTPPRASGRGEAQHLESPRTTSRAFHRQKTNFCQRQNKKPAVPPSGAGPAPERGKAQLRAEKQRSRK